MNTSYSLVIFSCWFTYEFYVLENPFHIKNAIQFSSVGYFSLQGGWYISTGEILKPQFFPKWMKEDQFSYMNVQIILILQLIGFLVVVCFVGYFTFKSVQRLSPSEATYQLDIEDRHIHNGKLSNSIGNYSGDSDMSEPLLGDDCVKRGFCDIA